MIDFTQHVRIESQRFVAALDDAGPTGLWQPVSSCPGWTVAGLTWHLAEVQDFWTHILDQSVSGPGDYEQPARPPDAALPEFLAERSVKLIAALDRPDDDPCWSWSPRGGTVGWVRRRQAQEALIHRVDAELALDARTAIDEALAGDGVDEILRGLLDVGELPAWASFNAEPTRIVLDTNDRWWSLRLGRFVGTDPDGGDPEGPGVDVPALSIEDSGVGPAAQTVPSEGDTRIAGTAADLDLWLWGRTDAGQLTVTGDGAAAARLRATAASVTR